MAEYRHRTTGEVKTQGEWRKAHPNTSLPRVWKQATLDYLNLDPVFATPKPVVEKYQIATRNGVEQDAKGNWVEVWNVVSMFNEYTDEEGVTHTVAEQEAAYQARLDADAAASVRTQRDSLLAETDWTQARDVVLVNDDDWKTYRQALRDITTHANFPYLNDEDWPTQP